MTKNTRQHSNNKQKIFFSKKTKQVEKQKSRLTKENFSKLYTIFRYVLPYKWTFALGMVFLVLSTASTLVFPFIASVLTDASLEGNSDGANWTINQLGLGLLIILLIQAIFSYIRVILFAKVSENAMADVRKDLYTKLLSLNIPFFEQRRVGELTSRITADVTQLQSAFSINLAEFFRQIATLVVGIAIILYTSVKLTLLMLSTFPLGILGTIIFGRYIRKLSKETQDALANANVVVEESLQSIQVVKAFTNEWFEVLRYNKSIDNVVHFALRAAHYRGIFISFIISAVFGGIVLVLWYGAGLVAAGEMTIGELVRFILYTFFIGGAVGGMGNLYGVLQTAIGASKRVMDILEEESEISIISKEENINASKSIINGAIIYQNVHFSYPTRPDILVLNDISFHINKGQKVALVGPSGSGKSTIVQLLLRFYKLDKGGIFINQQNIEQYDILKLRKNVGIVPQEVILFGGTIRENIAYGEPHATEAEIYAAAQQANALEFIESFPEQLDTIVGERGVKLSGGQRQRIAIARAILKDPAILILDEATSSLDAESEKLVQDALDRLMEDRTTIIIAHRLATIRKVDCIYVLENGQIIEQGSHQELSKKEGGLYQNLLKLQLEIA